MLARASLVPTNGRDLHSADFSEYKKEEISAHHARDLVRINAGGTQFATLYDTLAQSKSSYFLNFIRIDRTTGKIVLLKQRTIIDETGAIFVNRDGHLFTYILQFMRDGKNTVLPRDRNTLLQLKREADFFGMEVFKYLIQETLTELEQEQRSKNGDISEIRTLVNQIANNTYFHN
uniref:FHA domain-containing protein n=1 Tax=Caenorhabditis japonica TaxID=281687 RepID=A0A8R1DP60_CAEJA